MEEGGSENVEAEAGDDDSADGESFFTKSKYSYLAGAPVGSDDEDEAMHKRAVQLLLAAGIWLAVTQKKSY